jgi:hypothetical protein
MKSLPFLAPTNLRQCITYLIMATVTRTRSRSRGRPANKPSPPARPLNRIRTNAYFSDPDYDQTTPIPKTASTPSPTWGKLRKNNPTAASSSTAPGNSHVRLHPSGGFQVLRQEEPSVSLSRPDGKSYYMSSLCAPIDHSPIGDFKDRISKSNVPRAKAMASPTFRQRSTSRPKRVEILSDLDQEDEEERMRLRTTPSWRKKRPDTPTSARGSIFDFPSKSSSRSSLDDFVLNSGFIWLVLVFLTILLGLSSPPETNTLLSLQSPYKQVCNYFGNPDGWNCNGTFNFTIENVANHCHNAAGTIYERVELLGTKANIEDLMHTCQSSIQQGTDMIKDAPANLKKSLCHLPGAEGWYGCAGKPVSKLTKTLTKIGSVISTPFGSASTKASRSWMSSSRQRTAQPITVRKVTETPLTTEIDHAEGTVKSVVESFASEAKSYATSKLSSASSAYLPFTSSSSTDHSTVPVKAEEAVRKSSLSDGIKAVSEIKDLELRYTLAVAKAELKMLQKNDTPIIITHTTYTKRHLNRLLKTSWQLRKEIDAFGTCMMRENEIVINRLSRKMSYGSWTESWGSFSMWSMGWTTVSANTAFKTLNDPPIRCRKSLVRMQNRVNKALVTREGLLKEIDRLLDLSYRNDFRRREPLYISVPLPWFRALGPFPHFPVITIPSIPWDPRYWFLGDDYWYRKRSQEEREESLKLHRLRMTLHSVRNASNGFGDIETLIELSIGNFTDVRNKLQSYSQQILQDPEFGAAFSSGKLEDAKKHLALTVQLRGERMRVEQQINAHAWHRFENGDDQFGDLLTKEMRFQGGCNVLISHDSSLF